jgi:hypothetical protein
MDTALLLTQVIAQLMCTSQHVAWILCKGPEGCAPVDVHVEIALQHARRLLGTHEAGESPSFSLRFPPHNIADHHANVRAR